MNKQKLGQVQKLEMLNMLKLPQILLQTKKLMTLKLQSG